MKNHFTLCFIFMLAFGHLIAQDNFRIIFPTNQNQAEINRNCSNCKRSFQQKQKEVQFSIKREGNRLYFHTNDKKWFNQIFKNPNDGLAIDVVSKDIYDCSLLTVETEQIRGKLLKPIYASRLKSGLKSIDDNYYRVLVGNIPSDLVDKDLEYNILFLGNKSLCRYQTIFDLKAYRWDLLDMGMYLDSISLSNQNLAIDQEEKFVIKYKTLRFKIPFEKNKSQYSPEDIKPLYDSLRLTNFNIKTINIKAYSSIEGSLKRNIELQKERANSIAEALQSYQEPTIKTTISSSENWVEFLNDIEGTKYNQLKLLSKLELKQKLVGSFSKEMEPILATHRKAIITLELERKDIYKDKSGVELIQLFNEAIKADKLNTAALIQNSIFDKLKNKVVSPDVLTQMEIPKQLKYVNFLNNNSAIKYQLDERQIIIVRDELETLKKLDPKNPKIHYNLAAISLRIWRYNFEPVNKIQLKNKISNLKNYGINQNLIDRMMINYHIIKSEQYMRQRDYKNKDKSVSFISTYYKRIPLSDFDYFSLAQFLSYYANIDMAAELLTKRARHIDVDEDLLFYYLNLTLIDEELTQSDDYRAIMLNAYNLNSERYCKIFNAIEDGGVTFQLLENDYLRQGYCENCNN